MVHYIVIGRDMELLDEGCQHGYGRSGDYQVLWTVKGIEDFS